MPKYIDRDTALSHPFANGQYDKENANEHFIFGYEGYKEWLEQLPTVDAEPVVRCDDCIYRDEKTPGQPNILCWQMHADDFCSYGTKREVGTYCEDIVSVVRCKDCKWCDITDYGAGEVLECILDRLYRINSISLEGETYFREVEPDDFCAWGEKREDD